jgi:hypothetical protein
LPAVASDFPDERRLVVGKAAEKDGDRVADGEVDADAGTASILRYLVDDDPVALLSRGRRLARRTTLSTAFVFGFSLAIGGLTTTSLVSTSLSAPCS